MCARVSVCESECVRECVYLCVCERVHLCGVCVRVCL